MHDVVFLLLFRGWVAPFLFSYAGWIFSVLVYIFPLRVKSSLVPRLGPASLSGSLCEVVVVAYFSASYV